MPVIRLTKMFEIEMAHALKGYDGLCKYIHGHSYKLEVTIKGTPINDHTNPKNGMVMDFKDLKKIVKEHILNVYDHALVLEKGFDDDLITVLAKRNDRTVYTPYAPTCEFLVYGFAEIIKKHLASNIQLHALKLYETSTSFAEWYQSDNL